MLLTWEYLNYCFLIVVYGLFVYRRFGVTYALQMLCTEMQFELFDRGKGEEGKSIHLSISFRRRREKQVDKSNTTRQPHGK